MQLIIKIITILSILFISCSCGNKNEELYIRIKLDHRLVELVTKYVKANPDYNTFVLMESPPKTLSGRETPGFLLGPDYKFLRSGDKRNVFLEIGKSRIYILSRFCTLIDSNSITAWENRHPEDSIVVPGYEYPIKITDYVFLTKAIYLYLDDNQEFKVINRPDSIFMQLSNKHLKFQP